MPSYRLITAAAITVVYLVIAGILLHDVMGTVPESGMTDAHWARVVFIFSAIGTLATTAAGVLLGVEVQQSNVNNARSEARQLRQAVTEALSTMQPGGSPAHNMLLGALKGSNAS